MVLFGFSAFIDLIRINLRKMGETCCFQFFFLFFFFFFLLFLYFFFCFLSVWRTIIQVNFFLIGLVFQEITETKMQLLDNSEVWLPVGELKVHAFLWKVSGEFLRSALVVVDWSKSFL